jgi:hypothetical protein
LVHISPPGGKKFKNLGLSERKISGIGCLDGEFVKRSEELEKRFGQSGHFSCKTGRVLA